MLSSLILAGGARRSGLANPAADVIFVHHVHQKFPFASNNRRSCCKDPDFWSAKRVESVSKLWLNVFTILFASAVAGEVFTKLSFSFKALFIVGLFGSFILTIFFSDK